MQKIKIEFFWLKIVLSYQYDVVLFSFREENYKIVDELDDNLIYRLGNNILIFEYFLCK